MSNTAVYHTTVSWRGEHWGHIVMGNGPEMPFSAPPDAQGHPGVFTPEDAFVAAVVLFAGFVTLDDFIGHNDGITGFEGPYTFF